MTAFLSGDRRRRSNSLPDSASVAVSETVSFSVVNNFAKFSALSLALARLAARFCVRVGAAVSKDAGLTLSSRSPPSSSSRHRTPLLVISASSSESRTLGAIWFEGPGNRLQRLLKSPRCEEPWWRIKVWSRSRGAGGGAGLGSLFESERVLSRSMTELKSQSGPSVCDGMKVCQEVMQPSVKCGR